MLSTKKVFMLFFVFILLLTMNDFIFSATFLVTNSLDSGPGSLRQAIIDANNSPGEDNIEFNIAGQGPHVIQVEDVFPFVNDHVNIDGYTQPGALPATEIQAAVIKIVLNGGLVSEPSSRPFAGLNIGNNCSIRGLVIQEFEMGINLAGDNNIVKGNYIGLNVTGTTAMGNDTDGIIITSNHNTVGGSTPASRNIISGNRGDGVAIFFNSHYNTIIGNYIGTDATGGFAIANVWQGISISGNGNQVGSENPGEGNVISGNPGHGVYISIWSDEHDVPINNRVIGNRIGTNATGTIQLSNGHGITINTAAKTTIANNLISGNEDSGISIDNEYADGNLITQNSIHSNGMLGIDLNIDWVTENDPGDGDAGANNSMNFPVLTSAMATPGRIVLKGYIDSPNPTKITLEFFANSNPDPTEYGEGEIFLGTAKPNTNGEFTAALSSVSPGTFISATATDNDNNTSEFAKNIEAVGPGQLGKSITYQAISSAPLEFALAQNHPNPFNPETQIRFQLPVASHVTLKIFNILGEKVRTLINGQYEAGYHAAHWDGKYYNGNNVSSGIYIYYMKAGTFSQVKKLSLIR